MDIYNRKEFGDRAKNLEVRLTDVLPTSEDIMFTGGELFGIFPGPGHDGEIIRVEGPTKRGRFVLIQNSGSWLHFHEVKVFGKTAPLLMETTVPPRRRKKRSENLSDVRPPPVDLFLNPLRQEEMEMVEEKLRKTTHDLFDPPLPPSTFPPMFSLLRRTNLPCFPSDPDQAHMILRYKWVGNFCWLSQGLYTAESLSLTEKSSKTPVTKPPKSY